MLQVTNRSSVLADGKHNEQMPDAVRAAADAVQALRPLRRHPPLGNVRGVEDQSGDVG